MTTKEKRSRAMMAVKSTHTTPEMTVRRLAHALGYRYRLHVAELPGKPDLVFPRLRKIIDVRGCFWHLHGCQRCRIPSSRRSYWQAKLARNAERDQKTLRQLRRIGWQVLVIWECQTHPKRLMALQKRIEKFLSGND